MVSLFSIPAFFIVLREVLEACLVVGIALAHLNKTGNTQYRKYVWYGAIAGIVVSLAAGIAFGIVFFVKGDQIFSGKAEKIFEGIAFLVAAALLTWMVIWIMVIGKELQNQVEKQIDDIVENDDKSTGRRKAQLFLLIFVQVLREGIETIIFLIGSANASSVGGFSGIPIPGILAIIVGLLASYLLFKGLVNLDIRTFFNVSSIILIAFAAGLVSHAFHELQEADWFGPWKPEDGIRDWYNTAMWSTKKCCNDKTNEFWAMLRALFGYQDTPTYVEWATYFAYWLIVIVLFIVINWASIKASRSSAASRAMSFSAMSFIVALVGFIYVLINRTWIGLTSMIPAFILSILSVIFASSSVLRIKSFSSLKASRKSGLRLCGAAWGALNIYIFALHLAMLICEGESVDQCGLDFFFFFGLIFDNDFNILGRQELDGKVWWPSLAVLSISQIVAFFFFGFLSFFLILASLGVDENGDYLGDDDVKAETPDPMEGVASKETA